MNLLKRQFGAKFVSDISRSPTLVADIKEIRKRGIKIRRIKGGDVAYTEKANKLICIGKNASASFRLTALAHEAYHALHGRQSIDRLQPGMTRRCFLNRVLNEETDCIVHELEVVHELLEAGVRWFDRGTMSWYHGWRRGGRAYIRRRVARTDNVFNEKFPDYYSRIYTELKHAKKSA